jgi:sterol desaturase/sphingolipid hydroxylase (fatty acid hydroxylase superfamily)
MTAYEAVVGFGALVVVLGYLMVVETLFPRPEAPPRPRWRDRGKALVFWLVYSVAASLLLRALAPLYAALGLRPLIPSLAPDLLPRPVGLVVAAVLAAFIGDFFYYWCHRFQHRFLWRFHAVHHSVREMSAGKTYHHVTEPVMRLALYTVPLALFIPDPYEAPVLGAVLAMHGQYLHAATRLNFGPLGRVIQDNRFHRIHHSIRPEHHDKNFGVFTTLWDHLFGTAYVPRADEWPETGVEDFPEPRTLGQYLLGPFTWRKGRAPAAAEAGQPA